MIGCISLIPVGLAPEREYSTVLSLRIGRRNRRVRTGLGLFASSLRVPPPPKHARPLQIPWQPASGAFQTRPSQAKSSPREFALSRLRPPQGRRHHQSPLKSSPFSLPFRLVLPSPSPSGPSHPHSTRLVAYSNSSIPLITFRLSSPSSSFNKQNTTIPPTNNINIHSFSLSTTVIINSVAIRLSSTRLTPTPAKSRHHNHTPQIVGEQEHRKRQ